MAQGQEGQQPGQEGQQPGQQGQQPGQEGQQPGQQGQQPGQRGQMAQGQEGQQPGQQPGQPGQQPGQEGQQGQQPGQRQGERQVAQGQGSGQMPEGMNPEDMQPGQGGGQLPEGMNPEDMQPGQGGGQMPEGMNPEDMQPSQGGGQMPEGMNSEDMQPGQGGNMPINPEDLTPEQLEQMRQRMQAGGVDNMNFSGSGPENRTQSFPDGPFTGENFPEWSDNLRNVEEMLGEQELREQAARVRNRAQAIRGEFIRHGTEPQWDIVQDTITKPLVDLRKTVSDKLAQFESDQAMVPIDRDPVPARFTGLVQRYFENLGEDNQ